MTNDRQILDVIGSWMEDGRTRLPDHVLDAVLEQLPATPQRRRRLSAWRSTQVNAFAKLTIAAAAVAVVAFVGLGLVGLGVDLPGGGGAQPSPSPTATPQPNPDGVLQPGSYAARPLPTPDDTLTVTYTVAEGWNAMGDAILVPAGAPGTSAPGGIAIQLIDVTTLNGDACRWSGAADDVAIGPTVDDLVQALRSQTAYTASDPVAVTIGGYSGERVDIVFPTELFAGQTATAPGCDEGVIRPWNTSAHGASGVYAQGPSNRWQANVLDVDGTRLVVVVEDFPGTSAADRAALDAIVGSLVITP